MAQRDEDEFYYIVGRKKRFLKIYGNRVNLDELDRIIKERFEHMDLVSAGIDDHIYVFLTQEELAEQVKEFVVKKTGFHPVAIHVVCIDEIPRNDSGKVLYRELESYYQ